jgi:cytochrome c oxidase subunit II
MTRHPHVWMGLLLWSVFGQAQAAWTTNMAPGATEVSHAVFDLHMTIFWICVAIGIVVFGAMFWSMIVHRRSTGQVAAKFHESTTVEILWTVVPLLILVAMAIPATKTLINTNPALASLLSSWKSSYRTCTRRFPCLTSTPRA